MKGHVLIAAYLVAMIVIIVAVDVLFLRHQLWLRLGTNVGIVALFVLGYFLLFKKWQLR